MKAMKSKFAGYCRGCSGSIKAGEDIKWSRESGAFHYNCAPSGNSRADQEYWSGRADGQRFSDDRKMYGNELAEKWAMEAEMAAYNRGDDY